MAADGLFKLFLFEALKAKPSLNPPPPLCQPPFPTPLAYFYFHETPLKKSMSLDIGGTLSLQARRWTFLALDSGWEL